MPRNGPTHLKEGCKQIKQLVFVVIDGWIRKLLEPAFNKRLQPQDAWLKVDHATAADSGWGRHSQVLNLKHHRHLLQTNTDAFKHVVDWCSFEVLKDQCSRDQSGGPVFQEPEFKGLLINGLLFMGPQTKGPLWRSNVQEISVEDQYSTVQMIIVQGT